MNKYIEESDVCNNGNWATEIEIVVISSLMDTPVFVHTRLPCGEKWLKHEPVCVVPPILKTDKAIYVSNYCEHFNIVVSVLIVFQICVHCCG